MIPENLNMEELTEARRKAIAASLRNVGADELKKLGEQMFSAAVDPWREMYFQFIQQNASETFHHGTTHDGIQVVYCNAKDKGVWFKPGVGMGLMQPQGLAVLKQVVEGR